MERLAGFKEHEVGDVHNVVDGLEANGKEPFLQPFRAGSNLHALYGDAGVAGGAVLRENFHGDGLSITFLEGFHGRKGKFGLNALAVEICVKVPSNANVRGCIYAVGRDFILYHGFVLETKVFLGGNAYGGVFREHHDAVVAGAYSKFVFGADHAEAVHSADFGLLDLEISGEDGPETGKEHLLARCHVGGAANHGEGLRGAVIYGGDMEVVAVRVRLAGENLRNYNALEAAFNHFPGFNAVYFNADGSHGLRHFLRGEAALQILF